MADPTTFPEEHVGEPLVYRRVSGLAIAAVIVAFSYALIVLLACASGLYKGMPVLMSPWIQALAVLGACLSLAALVHIRRSEETVAGSKLALWSLLLSVFFGLGYGAYYAATYFAIRQQADHFTQRWFTRLEEGKLNHAFLETQNPATRQRVNAEDEEAINALFPPNPSSRSMAVKSPLESFRENKLVRVVLQGGPATRATPLGVKDWEYAGGGYRVSRTYLIETEEGLFEAQVIAMGSASKTREYEGREWQIVLSGTGLDEQGAHISERAKEVAGLRQQSTQFLDNWGTKLVTGRLDLAYLDTVEPAERGRLAAEFGRRRFTLPAVALGVTAVGPALGPGLLAWAASPDADELARQLFLPGYAGQFHRHGILQTDQFRAGDVETKEHVLSAVKAVFAPARMSDPRLIALRAAPASGFRPWRTDRERLRLPHDCRLTFQGEKSRYSVDVTITTESDPGPVTASRRPAWRIISVELMHGEDATRTPRMPGQAAF